MSIVCATNFSPEAISASTAAGELARQRGEDLWLMFVMPSDTARLFGEQVFKRAEDTLRGEANRIKRLGVKVEHAIHVGKLHQILPRFVADERPSLVIAGDTRKEPNFLGTGTLARLGQHLEAPLLVVRDADRISAWARGQRPLKVVIGLDHTQSTDIAARWLEKLGGFGKLDVVGGYVFWPPVEHQRLGLPLPRTWNDQSAELLGALHHALSAKLPPSLPHRIRLEPAMGRVSDHLCALAADEEADLLVLGTHHRRALGSLFSVSEQCLQLAPMSVACIPASAAEAALEPKIASVDRVLIATDFSPTGDRAVAWGLGILAPRGAADLVHVASSPQTADEKAVVLAKLNQRIPPEARARGVLVNTHALAGDDAAQVIAASAERFNSAAICLGSAKHVLGSTALGVFEATRRPIFIVRPPEP